MSRGGKRHGAGRKPNPVSRTRLTVSVPEKYAKEIQQKFLKIAKAYLEKCETEL
jgi:hypothetical protein